MAPIYVVGAQALMPVVDTCTDVKQFYTKAFKDLPDFHRTIEDIIAEGDKV